MDQVTFEVKCTPRYLTVCSRNKASPLTKESGSWVGVFGIKEAFHTFSLVYDTHIVRSPGHKTMEVVVQPLLVRTFAVGITKHEMICVLQQSAVTG